MKDALQFIYQEQKELGTFGEISALLGWDQMTYMPTRAATDRSKQLSLLSRLAHEKFTADQLYQNVEKLAKSGVFDTLQPHDQLVVQRLKKDIEKARKVPSSFVEKMAKTTTLAYEAWEKARAANKFSIFAPHLEKIIELEREYCTYINLPGPAYNSLLDDYEEGMTVEILKREFDILRSRLTQILDKIQTSNRYHNQPTLSLLVSSEAQQKLGELVLNKLRFPKDRTRLDISTHPFTTSIGVDDVRITTNYERGNPLFSFFSTVHEAGHALYELGLPQKEFADTVISDAPSLGLHESQSRFWENMIARSYPFWQGMYPEVQHLVGSLENISLEQWYQWVNVVKPSLIRVEADELTYCLHIILRFELERELLDGKIKITELPNLWNTKMQEFLGIKPTNDVEGVLQDMHWSGGSFGYFPTYAIGSIYAAQLYHTLTKQNPETIEHIRNGDFSLILTWLRTNVHQYGRKQTADQIIKNICGQGLHAETYLNYLKDKYYQLYDV